MTTQSPRLRPPALVLFQPLWKALRPRRMYAIACFGRRGHYRSDGSCPHVQDLVRGMKGAWHRSRTLYLPFGDGTQELARAWRKGKHAEAQ